MTDIESAVEASRQAWRDNTSRNGAYCPTPSQTEAMLDAAAPHLGRRMADTMQSLMDYITQTGMSAYAPNGKEFTARWDAVNKAMSEMVDWSTMTNTPPEAKPTKGPFPTGTYSELQTQLAAVQEREKELLEQLSYANGTCDLAMKHRDAAEERVRVLEVMLDWLVAGWGRMSPTEYDGAIERARAALATATPEES